ncbi:MAG: 3-isopropylmalate dehydratase small subunit [Acidimicrobiales bacterium]|nr:3-isopropylmalate dehydratase small subunit [Acidimicrobiales bacterium]
MPDVDTDLISPSHGGRGDPGASAFAALRYLDDGSENPDFVLNRELFRGAPILLAGTNFGCGSSRETAVWALRALGIRCVIAESFGDIFAANCFQNGVLAISLVRSVIERIATEASDGADVEIDLRSQTLRLPSGHTEAFEIGASQRLRLLEGLDELDLGVRRRELVVAFQERDRERRPWVYPAQEDVRWRTVPL